MTKCEFCGEEKEFVATNSMHGAYCEECIRLAIQEENKALEDIRRQKAAAKGKGGARKDSDKQKSEMDEAFQALVNGPAFG